MEREDPLALCSGCEIVRDYLEASRYYAEELRNHGQPFKHIVPDNPKDACSSSYLESFVKREDAFGMSTFVYAKKGSVAPPLRSVCEGLHDGRPDQFRDLLTEGRTPGVAFCQDVCEASQSLTLLDKLHHAAFLKGGEQRIRLAPYALLIALLATLLLHYAWSILKRLAGWLSNGGDKAKKH